MSISIKIIDSIKSIEKNINKAIAEHVNNSLNSNKSNIVNAVKQLIPQWVKVQPEILSLLSQSPESLKGQFGIYQDTSSVVNRIIFSVTESITVKFIKYSNNLVGGFELEFQPTTFSNLLSLPEGHTIYKGGDLHWLNWLLLNGDSIIVTNYQYNPQTGLGRSGLGNMADGGSFRIPPQFSGTKDNNFITRSLVGPEQEKEITKIFIKYLQ
jgi:hypothetical protein